LVAEQHCIVTCPSAIQDGVPHELRLICQESFGLQPSIVQCSARTTVDEFSEAILVDVEDEFEMGTQSLTLSASVSPMKGRSPSRFGSKLNLDERRIADVIIATNLDLAPQQVQVQVLELLRTNRIFTRTSMHTAPKDGMLIVVLSNPQARLYKHLNDMVAMSHHHDLEDGLPRQERLFQDDILPPSFSKQEVHHFRELAQSASITGEIAEYLHNVVLFMRLNRHIKGGVTATATRQLRALASALAPLHGIDFVTPSLIALATRKVYPHRLILATADTERSLQWGSDPDAVKQMLEGVTVDEAIEDVLTSVETPL
ncbi:hypothetical protein K431DRAFT_197366, partial [Polychaeton citri CBS 116435]